MTRMISSSLCLSFTSLFCCLLSVYSIGQCTNLTSSSPQLSLGITCLGVVDYEYFLPTGVTTEFLNAKANELLSDESLSILPVKCQTSLKKAVCSQVFLKCPNNFNQLKIATYNYAIFSDIGKTFPIPFQRPCLNVCDNANKDCFGLLNVFNKQLNCLEKTDYSHGAYGQSIGNTSYPYPYTFDQSNKSTVCNVMPAVATVASTMEPYIFAQKGGSCAGIISAVYVPPGPKVSSALAPMQQPYVVQSLIEGKVTSGIYI